MYTALILKFECLLGYQWFCHTTNILKWNVSNCFFLVLCENMCCPPPKKMRLFFQHQPRIPSLKLTVNSSHLKNWMVFQDEESGKAYFQEPTVTSWWFQPIWNILVKMESSPNRGENKKSLKPPTRLAWSVPKTSQKDIPPTPQPVFHPGNRNVPWKLGP